MAADAIQEAYLRALQHPPSQADNLQGWLFRVATNVVRDEWKKDSHAKRIAEMPHRAPLADATPDPLASLERDEARRIVNRLLERLSDRERTVLLMREAGFSHREIAQAVDTTTRSVGTMIGRAFRKLQTELRTAVGERTWP